MAKEVLSSLMSLPVIRRHEGLRILGGTATSVGDNLTAGNDPGITIGAAVTKS